MNSQHTILLTNSNNTTPISQGDPEQFTVNLPTTIMLPPNCELCIGPYSVKEAVPGNVGRIIYVELTNIPVNNVTANAREGLINRIVGAIKSKVATADPERWVSLGNQYEIPLTSIDVRLTNQDGESVVNLQGLTEIMLYYRQERE